MRNTKRKSLKSLLLSEVVAFVAIIIIVITAFNVKMQSDKIKELTESVLAKESVSYSSEVYNWWSSIEERVRQTADIYKNIPELSHDDALSMLLKLTEQDPDSQDIYIGYGDESVFLDGSGWVPDDTFVFTDRAWYIGALEKKGDIYTSEPYVDASTGKTCLACAVMLKDNVVLSSDINFDKVSEKLNGFKSSSDEAVFYIINKDTKDILVSSNADIVGETVDESSDSIIRGLSKVFDELNTVNDIGADKVKTAKTASGKMMYAATEINETSWVVVSAVPYTFLSGSIMRTVAVTSIIAAVLLIILAVVLYIIINKYINPVSTVTDRINDISNGDFTVTLVPEGNNEITTLSERLNEYIANMRSMLVSLSGISNDMNANAGECYDISHNLSASNQSQEESIEKLNATLNSMNEAIDDVAKAATDLADTSSRLTHKADDVKKLCAESLESSTAGKEEMTTMTNNVTVLNDTINDLTGIIGAAAESIEKITGITDTINAISEQTNLLALNASIEAARAGDMGKGFAVVASEVGTLATQSTEATDTIRQLIAGITKNIEDIKSKADICVEDMKACMEGVGSANKSFDLIYDDVAKATEGITEIADGIERINDVAMSNAASTQEQASSITEILALSGMIVDEGNKLVAETESISNISENLNQFSDAIKADLSKYEL
ncbi:MAG: methyl-accepting chemotaxis protein [Lachnospiraceae bacterium]|nr:methyl-accepting chemotaxis protein [Lachnospiraceae bacterium]